MSELLARVARGVDTALDRSVLLGYSRIGYAVRRALPTWPADLPSGALRGTEIAVTGATSGLGAATATQLVALGAHVHLVVRNVDKGAEVAASLAAAAGSETATVWECDLADLASVRDFADRFVASGRPMHGLVHNAGALPATRSESAQGHELTMALHLLGPLAMTDALAGPLGASRARVVLVTSGGMYAQRLRADDPEYLDGPYSGATAYARSKRAQVELLPRLHARWAPLGMSVYATHPGWAATPGVTESIPAFASVTRPILRDADAGAETTTWLLGASPRPPGGGLWHDRRERPTTYLPSTRTTEREREVMWRWALSAAGLPTP